MKDEELREILEKHRKWLNNEDGGERADLHGTDLQEADLRRANLQEADLHGTCLRWASLQGANLWGANLQEADLTTADLNIACLHGTCLRRASLQGANLHGTDLRRADLRGANLDYSCWPLWYGNNDVIVDKRIASYLAACFCRLICNDPEVKKAQQAIKELAINAPAWTNAG